MGHPAKEGLRLIVGVVVCTPNLAPRVGHPAKEGLRLRVRCASPIILLPRVGHPAKEGLRLTFLFLNQLTHTIPEWVIQQKRD